MRTPGTEAERDEAVALVQDRQRWLTMHGLPVSARPDVPALFRAPQTEPAGLFEDGLLLACMITQWASELLGAAKGICRAVTDRRRPGRRCVTGSPRIAMPAAPRPSSCSRGSHDPAGPAHSTDPTHPPIPYLKRTVAV